MSSRSTPSASTRCASSGSWTRAAPHSRVTTPPGPASSCARHWRSGAGPRSADLAYERFAQDDAARLEELRLAAIEERIEADLRMGRHVEVVPELEGLVREHPLRERAHAQHMLALYRSGRQADALESFRDARRSLTEELGLEPGRELRALEQAILAQDPALDLPRARVARTAAPARRRRGLALIAAGTVAAGVAAAVAIAINVSGAATVAVQPNSVAVIDVESNRVIADVPVGTGPETVAAARRLRLGRQRCGRERVADRHEQAARRGQHDPGRGRRRARRRRWLGLDRRQRHVARPFAWIRISGARRTLRRCVSLR